ncbi:unnamed protein product, partial [Prorocentrum cordatum]
MEGSLARALYIHARPCRVGRDGGHMLMEAPAALAAAGPYTLQDIVGRMGLDMEPGAWQTIDALVYATKGRRVRGRVQAVVPVGQQPAPRPGGGHQEPQRAGRGHGDARRCPDAHAAPVPLGGDGAEERARCRTHWHSEGGVRHGHGRGAPPGMRCRPDGRRPRPRLRRRDVS